MTQADREEWLAAAVGALSDIPADLLETALLEARRKVDHPSKVIPFVTAHVEDLVEGRKNAVYRAQQSVSSGNFTPSLPAPEKVYCSGEEASEIIDRVIPWVRHGAERQHPKRHEGPPRMPTREDYIALGVDPSVLDAA